MHLDFSVSSNQLTFPSGVASQTRCTDVTIVSDGRLEDEETFCLTLVSSDPDVTAGSTAVTCIVITDTDSKSCSNSMHDYITDLSLQKLYYVNLWTCRSHS